MLITVAICTWNRADLLDQTLSEMRKLEIPQGVEWELLVVNNNCSDHTDEVLARHQAFLPLRRLHEPQAGHSHARNCALAVARGELLIWTDDDVLVDPHWIAAYCQAFERWPDAAFWGGAIEPWYETPPPPWVQNNLRLLEGMLVVRDLGSRETRFGPGQRPYGANMAMRLRQVQQYRFDVNLGRKGNELISADETAFFTMLTQQGCQGVWVPSAKLRHFVPADRLTLNYFWKFFHGYGRTLVRLEGAPQGQPFLGAPRWLYRAYFERLLQAFWKRWTRQPQWLTTYQQAAIMRGQIDEGRRQLRQSDAALLASRELTS